MLPQTPRRESKLPGWALKNKAGGIIPGSQILWVVDDGHCTYGRTYTDLGRGSDPARPEHTIDDIDTFDLRSDRLEYRAGQC